MVSIIVPVYNGEKFITRCIDSICKQTYINIQIVIINDGSTDNTKKICEKLTNSDKRILFITQKNKGVTAARKEGVKNSQGQYIYFVDCDDYLQPTHIELFRNQMLHNNCICLSNYCGHNINNSKDYIKSLLKNSYPWLMTQNMYTKDLLIDVLNTSRDINIAEDLIANLLIARRNINFTNCKSNGYIYTSNPNSVTHSRVYTLQYEEKLIAEVEKALGDNIIQYKNEVCYFYLRCLRGLISNNVKVPQNHMLFNEAKKLDTNIHLGLGDKIVLNVKNHYIVYILLKTLSKIRKFLDWKD